MKKTGKGYQPETLTLKTTPALAVKLLKVEVALDDFFGGESSGLLKSKKSIDAALKMLRADLLAGRATIAQGGAQ